MWGVVQVLVRRTVSRQGCREASAQGRLERVRHTNTRATTHADELSFSNAEIRAQG